MIASSLHPVGMHGRRRLGYGDRWISRQAHARCPGVGTLSEWLHLFSTIRDAVRGLPADTGAARQAWRKKQAVEHLQLRLPGHRSARGQAGHAQDAGQRIYAEWDAATALPIGG